MIKLKYKFIKYKGNWFHFIKDEPDLLNYLSILNNRLTDRYISLKLDYEVKEDGTLYNSKEHTDPSIYAMHLSIINSSEKRETIVDDISVVDEKYILPIISAFHKYGALTVNSNGGWCPIKYQYIDIKNSEIITKDSYVFPATKYKAEDIRIIQWQDGTHFYAKIGEHDVVIKNRQKWNTKKEAMEKAFLYLEILNKE